MEAIQQKPIIGVSTAFTGNYLASQVIFRFLENLQIPVIQSKVTKPQMIETGSTLASSDFCLPLRVYVGHIYHLLQEHPEINILVTPIIKGEHSGSSTCAKYRDLDGVIIRSLGSIVGYHLRQSGEAQVESLHQLIGRAQTEYLLDQVKSLPKLIAPQIESLEKAHLQQVCFQLYRNLYSEGHMEWKSFIFSADSREKNQVDQAFERAYQQLVERKNERYQKKLEDKDKIRLAIVGRNYLTEDPALSADIQRYFSKRGVEVFTIQDIPFEQLENLYHRVTGFYDTHKLGHAFIDYLVEKVDGFIVIGSFGCHPDAFQVEYFTQYIREKGKAVWSFKFDEQAGGVGFHTRFETILGFLEQKRDQRIALQNQTLENQCTNLGNNERNYDVVSKVEKEPIFLWPHMGPGIDLILKETWNQFGLKKYLYPPQPVDEDTIQKGNVHYTETCSPFALSMGSVRQTIDRLFADLEKEALEKNQSIQPRRIIILMARGKGPCTFGWYSIAGEKAIKEEYAERLKQYGHTLEMFALDNEGRDLISFLKELANVAENQQIEQMIQWINQIQNQKLNRLQKTKIEINMIQQLKKLVWPGWEKLLAYEEIQNKALTVRAHEIVQGAVTEKLKYWVQQLDDVHTLQDIEMIKWRAIEDLDQTLQDTKQKPKVVVVGEIYVALTSFANRGAVDHLLGQHGIEAVEGMRLSHFIKGALKGLKYHYIQDQPLLKPLLNQLASVGLYEPNQWVREPFAKPFLEHEIGGDGQPTVAHARQHIEQDGVDGILHIYPFKCMPEGMAKDALDEMSQIYGVKSIHLSFDKEIEIERLRTEIGTFATLLEQDLEHKNKADIEVELKRRQQIGLAIEKAYNHSKKSKRSWIQRKAL